MSQHLAARRSAIAHRGRVIASLAGLLALVVALFATAASAGVPTPGASYARKPPAGKPAPPAYPPKDANDEPADKPGAKPPAPEHKPAGKPAHDENDENDEDDEPAGEDKDHNQGRPAGCDSSGPGNPCHPPQECGRNSGPGNANDRCPREDEDENACVAGNEGHGKAADHENDYEKLYAEHEREGHKGKHAGERDDAECVPPPAPTCGVEGKPACGEDHKPVCGVAGKPACHNNGQPVDNNNGQPVDNNNGQPVDNNNGQPVDNNNNINNQQQQPINTVAGQQAGQQASAAQPAASQPRLEVAGTQAARGTARLRAQTRCGTRSFRLTISGRSIRRVTLFVAGRRVRTVTVRAGRRSITVNVPVRRFGARRQSVRARVTFRNGAPARTLTASAMRCAQTAVSPQFTG